MYYYIMPSVFTQEDYNSSNGMSTAIWGPLMWSFLHTMSFNYPVNPTDKDKKNYSNYIFSLQHVLPCVYCRKNLASNLKKAKFNIGDMKNRDTFSRFIYRLHNCVNTMLGKTNTLTYAEVRDRHENFRSRCNEKTKPTEKTNEKKEKNCNGS